MKTPITAKKSCRDGHVSVRVILSARGFDSGSVRVEGGTDLSTAQARELAKALLDAADRADEKVSVKAASDKRRRKYREREIAAGRMVVMRGLR